MQNNVSVYRLVVIIQHTHGCNRMSRTNAAGLEPDLFWPIMSDLFRRLAELPPQSAMVPENPMEPTESTAAAADEAKPRPKRRLPPPCGKVSTPSKHSQAAADRVTPKHGGRFLFAVCPHIFAGCPQCKYGSACLHVLPLLCRRGLGRPVGFNEER